MPLEGRAGLLSCFWYRFLTVYVGDRPAGKKRWFWFRGAGKAARCGVSPVKRDSSAGRKGLRLFRTAPKPAQHSPPAVPLLCEKRPSESDPPAGREGLPRLCPACQPAPLLPPAAPLLHWPEEQETPCKHERILLAWPQFPTSARLLCRNQRHCYEPRFLAQPLPPSAPKLVVCGQGPVKRAPVQAGGDCPNSRPLCCPAGPCLQVCVPSLESSPSRRDYYWF